MPRQVYNSTSAISKKLSTVRAQKKRQKQNKATKKATYYHNESDILPTIRLNSAPLAVPALTLDASELPIDEDITQDYVFINSPSEDSDDYIIDDFARFNTDAYQPHELNKIIFTQYKKILTHSQSVIDESLVDVTSNRAINVADIFKKQDQKIVLFRTVKEYASPQEHYLLSLSEAILSYKRLQLIDASDIIVIPVAGLSRRHFRLLTITHNTIEYFDSKSYLFSTAAELLAPLLPAINLALNQAEQSFNKELAECERKAETGEAELTLATGCQIIAKAVGSIAYNTVENYPAYYDQIKQVCVQHFPNHTFYERPLGHQAFNENTDCGPYIAMYAEQIANALPPQNITANSLVIRAHLFGHEQHGKDEVNQEESQLSVRAKA